MPEGDSALETETGTAGPERETAATFNPDGSVTYQLSEPVKVPGKTGEEMSDRLTFRKPNGGDVTRHGMPVIIDYSGGKDMTYDAPKMTAMMAALAGVPSIVIERLDVEEWHACAFLLSGFFGVRLFKIS